MRKLFVVLAIIFAVFGVLFTALQMDSIPLLPIGLSLLFSVLAFFKSEGRNKKTPIILLIIGGLSLAICLIQLAFVENEVAKDEQFEKVKIESQKEDLKELEELDGL